MAVNQSELSRRRFLQTSALGAVGSGFLTSAHAKSDKKTKIDTTKILNYNPEMKYRPVGNTGVYLSVISMGGLLIDESVHHYAIDHGVNFVHISKKYKGGSSIRTLSKVMKTKRDHVYIAMKDNFDDIDKMLKLLHTDHFDFIMFNRHNHKDVNDPRILERFEKYKKQGKVRFMGLTSHKDVKACMRAGIESGNYQLLMPVLNQPALESMTEEIRLAHQKGIGVMGMKTMKGIKKPALQMAYLKKLLQNPAVTTVTKGINSFEVFDQYFKAMQEELSFGEDISLYKYAQSNRANNCMMCSECEGVCPHDLEISTMLRSKDYYYEEIGDKELAVNTLRNISRERLDTQFCRDCHECEAACPNGIHIVERLEKTHRLFDSYLV
ncbi:MAG: hypothetical protein GWP06_15185 [Actinobacteria bacterium]|nr:hypothetical protein [Actinomycetota bacterium]